MNVVELWLGHAPTPRIELAGGTVRLWPDVRNPEHLPVGLSWRGCLHSLARCTPCSRRLPGLRRAVGYSVRPAPRRRLGRQARRGPRHHSTFSRQRELSRPCPGAAMSENMRLARRLKDWLQRDGADPVRPVTPTVGPCAGGRVAGASAAPASSSYRRRGVGSCKGAAALGSPAAVYRGSAGLPSGLRGWRRSR